MSVASTLSRGRRAAERLMVDRCVIRRKTGETTDADGNITPNWQTIYDDPAVPGKGGKCRLKQPAALARADEVGEATLLMLRRELQLPVASVAIQADDVVQMTVARHDPDLAGRTFVVHGLHHASQAVMRRLQVEERTS